MWRRGLHHWAEHDCVQPLSEQIVRYMRQSVWIMAELKIEGGLVMSRVNYKRHIVAFTLAAIVVLLCLTLFLAAPKIGITAPGAGGDKADSTNGDASLLVLENGTGTRWNQLSRLNVFANADYGGQHIIAPESRGEYAFTVRNGAEFPLKYTLKISDKNEAGVPMKFRLKQGDSYIAGSDDGWTDISALTEISSSLPYDSETVYLLEWHWQGDNDTVDTNAGIAAQDGAKYILDFNISVEQSGDPVEPIVPVEHNKMPLWLGLTIIFAVLLILLLLLILIKRRKKDEEDTQKA